jgi:hypothetical protein
LSVSSDVLLIFRGVSKSWKYPRMVQVVMSTGNSVAVLRVVFRMFCNLFLLWRLLSSNLTEWFVLSLFVDARGHVVTFLHCGFCSCFLVSL